MKKFGQFLLIHLDFGLHLVFDVFLGPQYHHMANCTIASDDKTVRLWEISTGKNVTTWTFETPVTLLQWNPNKKISLLAVARYVVHICPFPQR